MTKNEPAVTLQPFLTGLEVGAPIHHENLTLVSLRGEGHDLLDYDLSRETLAAGSLSIQEIGETGRVPELVAVNQSERMVLLVDGEELLGAKQNRILNTSVLLAAKKRSRARSRRISPHQGGPSLSASGIRWRAGVLRGNPRWLRGPDSFFRRQPT